MFWIQKLKFLKLLFIKHLDKKIKSQLLILSRVFTKKLSGLLEALSWHIYRNHIFRNLYRKPPSPRKHRQAALPCIMFQMHHPTGILGRWTTSTLLSKEKDAPQLSKRNNIYLFKTFQQTTCYSHFSFFSHVVILLE